MFACYILFGCTESSFDPCRKVEIGMTESLLIKALGEPKQSSEELDNKKVYMFANRDLAGFTVVELERKNSMELMVSHCNAM